MNLIALLFSCAFALFLSYAPPVSAAVMVACGAPDDTPAINAAIVTAQAVRQKVALSGLCNVCTIDNTMKGGSVIQGEGSLLTVMTSICPGQIMIDNSGSTNTVIRDLRIAGRCTPGDAPSIGVLAAQTTAGYTSDRVVLDEVRFDGCYLTSPIYNFGVASSYMIGGQLYNYHPGGMVMVSTSNNAFSVASSYVTLSGNLYTASDWTLMQTEVHNFGNGWAFWFGGHVSFRMVGGNVSSQHRLIYLAAVPMDPGYTQYPWGIDFTGTVFYGDEITGISPDAVLCGHTAAVTSATSIYTTGIPWTGPC